MHWTRLVLGRGHPFIVIMVLSLVGAGICWFSLLKISLITQAPTRYVMEVEVNTEGCDDVHPGLVGDIGSFGPSFLGFRFSDENSAPILVGGCRLRSIVLSTNLALQPTSFRDGPELIRVYGADLNAHAEAASGRPGPVPWDDLERVRATVADGALRALDQPNSTGAGPSFSIRVEEDEENLNPIEFRRPGIRYEVAFVEEWQPLYLDIGFVVPENVRTYFEIWGLQADRDVPEDRDVPVNERAMTPSDLDMSVSFTTDEVSVVRGLISDSGNAESIDGALRFGIENNDAESRRESGNVRYSAVLGIGIALIVEAFVILLAIGVRALAARLGIVGAGRSVGENG